MVIYLIRVFLNLMRPPLKIKSHITKLKIMKHQMQSMPMKMIEKTERNKTYATPNFYVTNITR